MKSRLSVPAPDVQGSAYLPTAVRDWESSDGKRIRGSVQRIGTSSVIFQREDGQEFPAMPISRLCQSDQDYLERIVVEARAADQYPFLLVDRKKESGEYANEMLLYALTCP